ncbi:hypothetical protein HON22_01500, partial [Candidatus Peregrinibacteria bacterium]|nr:hypothetical protein [Candidatus Peregrinibacteria bacterium]
MKNLTCFLATALLFTPLASFAANTFPSGGNVGIGTANPLEMLHITKNQAGIVEARVQNNTGNPLSSARFRVWTGGKASGDPYFTATTELTDFSFGIDNSDGDKFKISRSNVLGSHDYFTIDVLGKVGIGTTSPRNLLHVQSGLGDAVLRTGLDTPLIVEGSGSAFLQVAGGVNSAKGFLIGNSTDSAISGFIYDEDGGGLAIKSGGANRAYVSTTGNVG